MIEGSSRRFGTEAKIVGRYDTTADLRLESLVADLRSQMPFRVNVAM